MWQRRVYPGPQGLFHRANINQRQQMDGWPMQSVRLNKLLHFLIILCLTEIRAGEGECDETFSDRHHLHQEPHISICHI